jgi:hypothetical protein
MHLRDDHDGASSPWEAAGRERPVFLDEEGRRHRLLRPFGLLAVLLASGWLAGLLVGATGYATIAPLPGALAGRPLAHLAAPPAARHRVRGGPAHLRTRLVAERTRLRPAAIGGASPSARIAVAAASADRS